MLTVRGKDNRKVFAERLVQAVLTLTELARPIAFAEKTIPMCTPNGIWYWFDGAALQHRWKCIKQLLDHKPWAAKFSVTYMNGTIKKLTDAGIDGGLPAIREKF